MQSIILPPKGGYPITKPAERTTSDDVRRQIDDFFSKGGQIEELPGPNIEKNRKPRVTTPAF